LSKSTGAEKTANKKQVNFLKICPENSSLIYPVTNKCMLHANILPIIHGVTLPEKCIDEYQIISL
jgi:hypothetical protein